MKINIIQDIIDKIRCKVPINGYIKILGNKIITYEKIKNDIDTLILGSSHAQLGYRAKGNIYNLGVSFQDLYYSYKLYEKYSQNIKNVILFYSVFSPGNQTIKTNFSDTAVIYKIITGIDYQESQIAEDKNLYDLENSFKQEYEFFKSKFHCNIKSRGNEKLYKSQFKNVPPSERANKHLKNNLRHNNQTEYVIKMQKLANSKNARFLVVIPPATSSYKACLPPSEELFNELFSASRQNNIEILNMYDTTLFSDSEFIDSDHLSLGGAKKLTKVINEYITK